MTREEAIKTLEFAKAYINRDGVMKQSIDVALSALRSVSREQVKRERDAAVADLEHLMLVVNAGECCMMCKHDHEHLTGPCAGQSTRCEPEWRGPQKED